MDPNSQEQNRREDKRRPTARARWAVSIVAFLLGYPLSLGPLQKLIVDNHLPAQFYTLHAPLIWYIRAEHNPLTRWYWSYLNWWIAG